MQTFWFAILRSNIHDWQFQFNELRNELATVGITFIDEELNDILIDALPRSWEVIRAILAGRETMPTFFEIEDQKHPEEVID